MSGIILLLILIGWGYAAKKISGFCIIKMYPGPRKTLAQVCLFALFFLAPVVDEIIGGFQFRAMCTQGTKLIYVEEKVRGKKLLWSGMPRIKIDDTVIPIEEEPIALVDLDTKMPLITYRNYYATGGWLSRFIAFNSVTRPYTFDGVCGAKDAVEQLRNRLNIETTFIGNEG